MQTGKPVTVAIWSICIMVAQCNFNVGKVHDQYFHYSEVTWATWCLKSLANWLFFNSLFRLTTKNASKLSIIRVMISVIFFVSRTYLSEFHIRGKCICCDYGVNHVCDWKSPVTVDSPHNGRVTRRAFSRHDVIIVHSHIVRAADIARVH